MRILLLYRTFVGSNGTTHAPTALVHNGEYLRDMIHQAGFERPVVETVQSEAEIFGKVNVHVPNLLVLEGTWVRPETVQSILSTYPEMKVLLREHARLGFLNVDGSFIEYWKSYEYISHHPSYRGRLHLSMNSADTAKVMSSSSTTYHYLPNYYTISGRPRFRARETVHTDPVMKVACFGSLRLMKNQLTQAYAAIHAADSVGAKLEFYCNAPLQGDDMNCVHLNLVQLFKSNQRHVLRSIGWSSNDNLKSVMSSCSMLLQCSMSESYNFTVCDAITCGIPVVTSPSVDWLSGDSHVQPDSVLSVSDRLVRLASDPIFAESLWTNQFSDLKKSNFQSKCTWLNFLRSFC